MVVEKGQDFVHVVIEWPIGKKLVSIFKIKQFKAHLLKIKSWNFLKIYWFETLSWNFKTLANLMHSSPVEMSYTDDLLHDLYSSQCGWFSGSMNQYAQQLWVYQTCFSEFPNIYILYHLVHCFIILFIRILQCSRKYLSYFVPFVFHWKHFQVQSLFFNLDFL